MLVAQKTFLFQLATYIMHISWQSCNTSNKATDDMYIMSLMRCYFAFQYKFSYQQTRVQTGAERQRNYYARMRTDPVKYARYLSRHRGYFHKRKRDVVQPNVAGLDSISASLMASEHPQWHPNIPDGIRTSPMGSDTMQQMQRW